VETLTENIMMDDLASDAGNSDFTHFNYASVSATGIAIDGVVGYPSFNNTLSFAQEVGEIASAGLHSGRGLGAHYHADGHSATGSGLNLYNAEDYEGHTHPPLISLGFDGVAVTESTWLAIPPATASRKDLTTGAATGMVSTVTTIIPRQPRKWLVRLGQTTGSIQPTCCHQEEHGGGGLTRSPNFGMAGHPSTAAHRINIMGSKNVDPGGHHKEVSIPFLR
jgi:hypothetical protein